VLFNDTIRYNLDPFSNSTEAELHEVVRIVQLGEVVDRLAGGLDHKVMRRTAVYCRLVAV
jgi:ABC-type multidrug transport system fused ATPase/permease subunit